MRCGVATTGSKYVINMIHWSRICPPLHWCYRTKICTKYRKHWKSYVSFHLSGQTGLFLVVLKISAILRGSEDPEDPRSDRIYSSGKRGVKKGPGPWGMRDEEFLVPSLVQIMDGSRFELCKNHFPETGLELHEIFDPIVMLQQSYHRHIWAYQRFRQLRWLGEPCCCLDIFYYFFLSMRCVIMINADVIL